MRSIPRTTAVVVAFVAVCQNVPEPGLAFEDVTARTGIDFRHAASQTSQKYLPEAMGSGVAIFDYDNDGREDIFFVNAAELKDPMPPGSMPRKTSPKFHNRLYRNLGGWKFEDVTTGQGLAGEGYGMGVATGDFDSDGRTDLYVTAYGRNYLYRNTPSGFREMAAQAGVEAGGWSVGAAFLDYDRDGRLDLFVVRYLEWTFATSKWCGEGEGVPRAYCHPRMFRPATNLLFRNRGDGTFEDVSAAAGIQEHAGKGLGVKTEDVNDDGWPDVVVANDSAPQQLFVNRNGNRFEEVALRQGVAFNEDGDTYAGMGVDVADIDGDGRVDLFVNALARQGYWLYRRTEKGSFEAASTLSGLQAITGMRSGWGARLVDLDNDGWKDLIVAQGHVMDTIEVTDPAVRYREPPLLAKNVFGRFFDVGAGAGPAFAQPRAGRGLAAGDLDGDGLLDIVINNNNEAPSVLRNARSAGNGWLAVRLRPAAHGARAVLTTSSGRRLREYMDTSGSYLSASSLVLHFGLGEDEPATLEVLWPSGARSVVRNLPGNRYVEVTRPASDAPAADGGTPASRRNSVPQAGPRR